MQSDATLQAGRQRQTTGNAPLGAEAFSAVAQAAVMHRAEGHADLAPIVHKVVKRGGHPGITKGEVFLGFGIESGFVPEPVNISVLAGYSLIDFAVVNHVLNVFSRRPGKDEDIMALAGLDLRRCTRVNLLHW